MTRSESTTTTTAVRHVAQPLGRERENGPHLADLREFVQQCEGMPDHVRVHVDKGRMGESGRYDVEFRATWSRPEAST